MRWRRCGASPTSRCPTRRSTTIASCAPAIPRRSTAPARPPTQVARHRAGAGRARARAPCCSRAPRPRRPPPWPAAVPGAVFHERAGLVVVKPRARPAGGDRGRRGRRDRRTCPSPRRPPSSLEAAGVRVSPGSPTWASPGVHRLLDRRGELDAADCCVVVAGMEGALPSVVAGSRPPRSSPCPPAWATAHRSRASRRCCRCCRRARRASSVVNIDSGFAAAQVRVPDRATRSPRRGAAAAHGSS